MAIRYQPKYMMSGIMKVFSVDLIVLFSLVYLLTKGAFFSGVKPVIVAG